MGNNMEKWSLGFKDYESVVIARVCGFNLEVVGFGAWEYWGKGVGCGSIGVRVLGVGILDRGC